MQTFLPYPDFARSAQVLDNKRLGKQRVECLQILKTLAKQPQYCPTCYSEFPFDYAHWLRCSQQGKHVMLKKTPWYNHPAVKMWRGYEQALVIYGLIVCNEWRNRNFKDTCEAKIKAFEKFEVVFDPPWLGNADFHASHRSNLLRKDPVWYSKFGWTEPPTLEYVWPVK